MTDEPGAEAKKKFGRMTIEDAQRWYESLGPEQVEAEGERLLDRVTSGELDKEHECIAQLWVLPLTPERCQCFETKLDACLKVESKHAARSRGFEDLHTVYPDYSPVVEYFAKVDRRLNPQTWQQVLRRWARRRADELLKVVGYGFPQFENWESCAVWALKRYLERVEQEDRTEATNRAARLGEEEAARWVESLIPETADKEARSLLYEAVMGYLKGKRGEVVLLRAIPVTAERVSEFESMLLHKLEEDTRRGYATGTIANYLASLDGLLKPETWQAVLRNWAKRLSEELAKSESKEPWQSLAVDALNLYLSEAK